MLLAAALAFVLPAILGIAAIIILPVAVITLFILRLRKYISSNEPRAGTIDAEFSAEDSDADPN